MHEPEKHNWSDLFVFILLTADRAIGHEMEAREQEAAASKPEKEKLINEYYHEYEHQYPRYKNDYSVQL